MNVTEDNWSDIDRMAMSRALKIAERGLGQVSPNPPVGCVLVSNGEIVAEGWHDHLGDLHAEQAAIAHAEAKGVSTHGCTAYVTLEPCNHHGRTPPCTEALLWAGISKVVIAAGDPNPTVRGGGIEHLRTQGIEVLTGLMENEARTQMAPFMTWCECRKPYVILKAALDNNGKIAGEESFRFTSDDSLDAVHMLRRNCDAILVGVNTVVSDNPSLDVRRVDLGLASNPLRVICDPSLRSPDGSKVLTDGSPTLVLHTSEGGSLGDAECLRMSSDCKEIDIDKILDLLGDRGIQSIIVEGGADVWRRFLKARAVDEALVFHSEVDLGDGVDGGINEDRLRQAGLELVEESKSGADILRTWKRVCHSSNR